MKEELLKLNTIPVIVYEEEDTVLKKFFDFSKFNKAFRALPRIKRDEKMRKMFRQRSVADFDEAVGMTKNYSGPEYERLEKLGFSMERVAFQNEKTANLLVGTYLIVDNKIVAENHQVQFYDRFDITKVTLGFGLADTVMVNTVNNVMDSMKSLELKQMKETVFGTDFIEKSKKKLEKWKTDSLKRLETIRTSETKEKEKLQLGEILGNPKYLKYFKAFAASEFSSENVLFFEQQNIYKVLDIFENRKMKGETIYHDFLTPEGEFEINTKAKYIQEVQEKMKQDNYDKEIFNLLWDDLFMNTVMDTYSRFIFSDLYAEMTEKKQIGIFLFRGTNKPL
jgi:hypothetical protein